MNWGIGQACQETHANREEIAGFMREMRGERA